MFHEIQKKHLKPICFGIPAKKNSTTFLPASCSCFIPSCSTYIWNRNERLQGDPTLKSLGLRSRTSLLFFWGGMKVQLPHQSWFWNPTFDQGWVHPMVWNRVGWAKWVWVNSPTVAIDPITSISMAQSNLGKFVKVVFPSTSSVRELANWKSNFSAKDARTRVLHRFAIYGISHGSINLRKKTGRNP